MTNIYLSRQDVDVRTYTENARRTLFFARYEASALGSPSIETDHLLLGLIREAQESTTRIFAEAGVSLPDLRREVEQLAPLPAAQLLTAKGLGLSVVREAILRT